MYIYNIIDMIDVVLAGSGPVEADRLYTMCVENYHYQNSLKNLGLTTEEVANAKVATTSGQSVLEEYLTTHQLLDSHIEGRWTFIN